MKGTRMHRKADCETWRSHLPELLLDGDDLSRQDAPAQQGAPARQDAPMLQGAPARDGSLAAHLQECAACRAELHELRATLALLDSWQAPEPSAYFDARLHARLREAGEAAPEGLWGRLRSYLLYSTERGLRPALAVALAVVLVLGGGGTWIGLYPHRQARAPMSPTVNDLKIMDNNAQALQQMDQLLDPGRDDGPSPPTT